MSDTTGNRPEDQNPAPPRARPQHRRRDAAPVPRRARRSAVPDPARAGRPRSSRRGPRAPPAGLPRPQAAQAYAPPYGYAGQQG